MTCQARERNVFCELHQEGLELLNDSKILNHYKRGQNVFYAGNNPAGLYCVSGGLIKIENSGATGTNHILRVVGTGGVLGYRSLFADESYQSTATVVEDATICLIPKSSINELIKKNPELALKFLQQVSKELRAAEDRFCGVVDKDAPDRVAEALLFLKDNFGDQVWTRKDIAEWAGTTPETVMRTLAQFEDNGFIEQVGRKINVKDRKALLKIANL